MKSPRHILLLLFLFTLLPLSAQFRLNSKSAADKIANAERVIEQLYVDTVNGEKMAETAIRAMLKELDPHSSYATPKEAKAVNENFAGSFEGVGIQFNIVDDTLMVVQTIVKGPSEKAGIIAGDRIVSVGGEPIAGVKMSREDIMTRLRGKKGTVAQLGVVRRGVKDVLSFNVVRDKIPLLTIYANYMITPTVGYIRIESFGENTYKEFLSAVQNLQEKGMQSLILDLQDNGGGVLQVAAQICNEFLEAGDMIVYTEGRKMSKQVYRAQTYGRLREMKVAVLVNEFSASASEIIAGALQDQDRALIVGRRSFGKGLVQRIIEFQDGSHMRLTMAHYYTPSGRCIQKPYTKGDMKSYANELDERLKHGELTNADSIHFPDSLRYYTLRQHRPVYGGGGIMPDSFVPLDTTRYTKCHRQLAAKNIILEKTLKHIDNNRNKLKKNYSSFDRFLTDFNVPQTLIDDIMSTGEKQNIKPKDEDERKRTLEAMQIQLKALIARDLWDMNEYYIIANHNNDIVQRAVQLMTDDKHLNLKN